MTYKSLLYLCLLGCLALMPSCISYHNLRSLNDGAEIDSVAIASREAYCLQQDDVLSILVQSSDMISAEPFNLRSAESGALSNASASSNSGYATQSSTFVPAQGYLIDRQGMIEMPQIGKIKALGLTTDQLKQQVELALKPFLKEALVTVRMLNYRITLLGEVQRPGTVSFPKTQVSLFEAVGMAGDMTPYAMRDSIMVIREKGGIRTSTYVNLHERSFLASPYYYLEQNDVVYIPPTKVKRGAVNDNYTRNAPLIISALSATAVILALFVN